MPRKPLRHETQLSLFRKSTNEHTHFHEIAPAKSPICISLSLIKERQDKDKTSFIARQVAEHRIVKDLNILSKDIEDHCCIRTRAYLQFCCLFIFHRPLKQIIANYLTTDSACAKIFKSLL